MASFREVLIKDNKVDVDKRNHNRLLTNSEGKEMLSFEKREEMQIGEEDIPDIDEKELPDCEKFVNFFLIGKLIGESVPLKTIISKTKSDWVPTCEVKYIDMGNGFILIKSANEMDCNHVYFDQPWFVQGQIFNLQRGRRDFDLFKESIKSIIIWVRLPRLPVEL